MKKIVILATLAAVIVSISNNARARTSAAPQKSIATVHQGEEVFVQRCFQCHSVLEGQVRFGPSLFGEMRRPHPKKTPVQVLELLKNGKGKMPPFKAVLADEEMSSLVAYLKTL
jgi:mono/diheme cytochrome c family protein